MHTNTLELLLHLHHLIPCPGLPTINQVDKGSLSKTCDSLLKKINNCCPESRGNGCGSRDLHCGHGRRYGSRRHLKWCQHLSHRPCLKTRSMSPSLPRGQSQKHQFSKTSFLYIIVNETQYFHVVSSLLFFTQEILQYQTRATHTPMLKDNPLEWWKQHGHLLPTLARLARRYLAIPATSCPVERFFSVAG